MYLLEKQVNISFTDMYVECSNIYSEEIFVNNLFRLLRCVPVIIWLKDQKVLTSTSLIHILHLSVYVCMCVFDRCL
jgi:hypothetical protein